MNYAPMLAVDCGGLDKIQFPAIVSPKLDGVRGIAAEGVALSRSLKPIPNRRVQELLSGLPNGFDGELIAGDPTAPDAYRKTVSMVMSDDKPIDGLVYHLFDLQPGGNGLAPDAPFLVRHGRLDYLVGGLTNRAALNVIPQVLVEDLDALLGLEDIWVGMGYEGVIGRKPDSPYKHDRSTRKEGYLWKLKRFVDGEAVVIGMSELMHNGNEATTNELGHTARSHKKGGLEPTGAMGTLTVRDTVTGTEFDIGTGFTAAERKSIWKVRDKLQFLQLAKYKHFPSGAKDKPRHPVFLGWRDGRDV
jgi:DNA ligase-1